MLIIQDDELEVIFAEAVNPQARIDKRKVLLPFLIVAVMAGVICLPFVFRGKEVASLSVPLISQSVSIASRAGNTNVGAIEYVDVSADLVPNYRMVSAEEIAIMPDVSAGELISTNVIPFGVTTSESGQKEEKKQVAVPAGSEVSAPVFTNTGGTVKYSDIKSILYDGYKIANVTIPRLGVDNVVVRYGGQAQINAGICIWSGCDIPGTDGVTLLCGHNYNKNWKIGNLQIGDRLYLDTVYGQYVFEVYNAFVNKRGGDVVWLEEAYFAANATDMMLMTCYPFDGDGLDGRRYLVQCRMIEGPDVTGEPASRLQLYGDFDTYVKSRE